MKELKHIKNKMQEKKRLRIGIDLDDTIWKFHENLIDFYNNVYGTDYKIEDYKIRDISVFFGITKDEERKLLKDFFESDLSEEVFFVDGFLDAFSELKEFTEIFFITARPIQLKEKTEKRLSFFSAENYPVHYVSNEEKRIRLKKVDFCEKLGIDFMIDDGLHNSEEFTESSTKFLLLDFPWNKKSDLSKNVIRVNSWQEILEKIKEENLKNVE